MGLQARVNRTAGVGRLNKRGVAWSFIFFHTNKSCMHFICIINIMVKQTTVEKWEFDDIKVTSNDDGEAIELKCIVCTIVLSA